MGGLPAPTIRMLPDRAHGVGDPRQAEYQQKMSALLAGRFMTGSVSRAWAAFEDDRGVDARWREWDAPEARLPITNRAPCVFCGTKTPDPMVSGRTQDISSSPSSRMRP
jgi:hypothetical protein